MKNTSFIIKLLLLAVLTGLPPGLLYLNLSTNLANRARCVSESLSARFVDDITGEIRRDAEDLRNVAAGFITSRSFIQAIKKKDRFWFKINLNPKRNDHSLYDGIAITDQGGKRIFGSGTLPPKMMYRKRDVVSRQNFPSQSLYSDSYRIDFADQIPLLLIDEIIPSGKRGEIGGIITISRKLDPGYFKKLSRRSGLIIELFPQNKIPLINWAEYSLTKPNQYPSDYDEYYSKSLEDGNTEFIILLKSNEGGGQNLNLKAIGSPGFAGDNVIHSNLPPIVVTVFLLLYIINEYNS